jgi:hypothetical protein
MTPTPMEIADFVAKRAASGSDFYQSMQQRIEYWGRLTERQLACVLKDMEPAAAARAPRASFDMTVIHAMFGAPPPPSRTRPTGPLAWSSPGPRTARPTPAASTSRTTRRAPTWARRCRAASFARCANAPRPTWRPLREIEAAPGEAAVKWGKMTGRCSCCGRTLSDPVSIERGIGPICAETWGI